MKLYKLKRKPLQNLSTYHKQEKVLNIHEMSRKEFEALFQQDLDKEGGTFDSLVIVPMQRCHESGYRMMGYVSVRGNEPLGWWSGDSDVLHLDGMLGTGPLEAVLVPSSLKRTFQPAGWRIDCLKKSGLLRLSSRQPLTVGSKGASFEVFAFDQN